MKKFFKEIFSYFTANKIVWRTTLWVWGLILFTMITFVIYTIPTQTKTMFERMEAEGSDMASSILHANQSSFITEDYGSIVDQCLQLVSGSKSILYIVITRKDGYSLVNTENNWKVAQFSGFWLPDSNATEGKVIFSEIVRKNVFHKSVKVTFSGIDWGWIHIGLSLDEYNTAKIKVRNNFIGLTFIMSLLGFLISFVLAKKLTKPIRILDATTKKITEGDLDARANVNTGDELENLARSFNKMTDSVREAKEELEYRVEERTAALAKTNMVLLQEISERKKIEKTLQVSLGEKDVLIKEIHHRVKNNLQIISSLLSLQSFNIDDSEMLNIFKDSQSRIKSMALVHEKLYQSDELSKINFSEYVQKLSTYIYQTYKDSGTGFRFIYDLDEIFLTIDTAIPLGLILNELLTNSFKYAFNASDLSDTDGKIIRISAKKFEDKLFVNVADNGIGLPKDFNPAESESLGLKLVYNLTEQLKGKLEIKSDTGASFTITLNHN